MALEIANATVDTQSFVFMNGFIFFEAYNQLV